MDYYVAPAASLTCEYRWEAPFNPPAASKLPNWNHLATQFVAGDVDLFKTEIGARAPTSNAVEPIEDPYVPTRLVNERTHADVDTFSNRALLDVEKLATQRVQLMARKYSTTKGAKELVARLEILNARMLEKAPRVTKEQVDALEAAHLVQSSIRTSREERARRLGLTV